MKKQKLPVPSFNRSRKKGSEGSKKRMVGSDDDDINNNNNNNSNPLSKYKTEPDPYHNNQFPACSLLEDAMFDVFPELEVTKKQGRSQQQQQQQQVEAAKRRQRQSSNDQTFVTSSSVPTFLSPKQQQQKRMEPKRSQDSSLVDISSIPLRNPTALGELLRWRFFQFQKAAPPRDSQDWNSTRQAHHEVGLMIAPPEQHQGAISTIITGKKKKKRKKKKKNGEDLGENTAGTVTVSTDLLPLIISSSAINNNSDNHNNNKDQNNSCNNTKNGGTCHPGDEPNLTISTTTTATTTTTTMTTVNSEDSYSKSLLSLASPSNISYALPRVLTLHHRSTAQVVTREGSTNPAEIDTGVHHHHHHHHHHHRNMLYQWMDRICPDVPVDRNGCSNKAEKDWTSFLEFCEQHISGIPLRDVVQIAEKIDCRSCQRETLDIISRMVARTVKSTDSAQLKLTPIVTMNPRYLAAPTTTTKHGYAQNDDEVEDSFAYMLMEEGCLPPYDQQDDDSDDHEKGNETGALTFHLSFAFVGNDTTKSISDKGSKENSLMAEAAAYRLFPKSLDTTSLDSFIEDWLPAGISECSIKDETHDTSEQTLLPPEQTGSLIFTPSQDFNKNVITDCLDEFCQHIDSDVEVRVREEIDKVANNFESGAGHYTAFGLLQGCDNMCNTYVKDQLIPILLYAEEKIHSDGDKPNEIEVWTSFLTAIWETYESCQAYYSSVEEEVVDQNGVIPSMFVNVKARDLCFQFVSKKIETMTSMGIRIKSMKDRRVMKRQLTEGFWLHSIVKEKRKDEFIDLGNDCSNLIVSIIEWTQFVHARRMKELRSEQRNKRESMREQIKEILEPLTNLFLDIDQYLTTEERDRVGEYCQSAKEVVNAQVSTMASHEYSKVFLAALSTVLMWRACRIGEQRMLQSRAPKPPFLIQQWMLDENDDLGSTTLDPTWTLCGHGWGGKRRLRCILAGLMHRWLSERCIEWKSETAAHELLANFDTELNSSTQTGVGNSSKLPKKNKKKKKKALSQNSSEGDPHYTSRSSSGSAEEIEPTEIGKGGSENGIGEKPETPIVNSSISDGVNNVQGNEKTPPEDSSAPQVSDVSTMAIAVDELEMVEHSTENPRGQKDEIEFELPKPSIMVVDDEENLISATDFLIGRLLDLMGEDERGHSCILSM
jgi:hypothetical protein